MAWLDPAIHVFLATVSPVFVDPRAKPGDDGKMGSRHGAYTRFPSKSGRLPVP